MMKRSDRKVKTKKAKTIAPSLYDCCWYEPSSDDLCCGGVCSYGSIDIKLLRPPLLKGTKRLKDLTHS